MNWDDDMHVALLRKAYARDLDTLTMRQDAALQRYLRDVFQAGEASGAKARQYAPAPPRAGVESPRTRRFWRAMELGASFTTMAGMWEGSTTVVGSLWYLAAGVLFIAVSFKRKLHGLQPLNFAAIAIETFNLWAALR